MLCAENSFDKGTQRRLTPFIWTRFPTHHVLVSGFDVWFVLKYFDEPKQSEVMILRWKDRLILL